MDNAKIKEMIKSDPEAIIGVIEQRVRHIDYTGGKNRNDLLDYISQSKRSLAVFTVRSLGQK